MQANKVPASKGLIWFQEGWRLFRRDPILWAGMALTWTLIATFLAFIPVLGPIVSMFLFPIAFAGLLSGAKAMDAGQPLRISMLWQALQEPAKRTQLLVLAIVPLGFAIVANALTLALGFSMFTAAVISVASIIMSLAIVFAVPLVYFHRFEAVTAMKASFAASVANVAPLGIFLVLNMLIGSIAVPITFGFAIVILLPITSGALYRAYQTIFSASNQGTSDPDSSNNGFVA